MRTYIVIRRSERYFNGDMDFFDHDAVYYRNFQTSVRTWNMFFNMKFLEFRRKLSAIAYSSYPTHLVDGIFHWLDFRAIEQLEEGSLLLPIDEDDFLAPDVIDVVKRQEDHQVYWWTPYCIAPNGEMFNKYPFTIASCAYLIKTPASEPYIASHLALSKGNDIEKFELKEDLSLRIEGISCVTFLAWKCRKVGGMIEVAKNRMFIQKKEELKKYYRLIDKYNELLAEFYDSCRV